MEEKGKLGRMWAEQSLRDSQARHQMIKWCKVYLFIIPTRLQKNAGE